MDGVREEEAVEGRLGRAAVGSREVSTARGGALTESFLEEALGNLKTDFQA